MALVKPIHPNPGQAVPLVEGGVTYLKERGGRLLQVEEEAVADGAFISIRNSWVLLDYSGYKLSVNGLRIADCKQVREGDQILFGGAAVQLIQEMRIETVQRGSVLLRPERECFFDLRNFSIGESVTYCPVCDTPYHSDCWESASESCDQCNYRPRLEST